MNIKTILLILTILGGVLVGGCQTAFDGAGKLRSISIARNVYMTTCGDCETMIVDTTDNQTRTLSSLFDGLFETITTVASGIFPRGISK